MLSFEFEKINFRKKKNNVFLTIFDGKQKLEVFAIFFVVGNMRTVILYLEIFFALFWNHIESITKYFEIFSESIYSTSGQHLVNMCWLNSVIRLAPTSLKRVEVTQHNKRVFVWGSCLFS